MERLARLAIDHLQDETGNERTGDAQQDRDDPTGVDGTGLEPARQRADDQSDDDHADDTHYSLSLGHWRQQDCMTVAVAQ